MSIDNFARWLSRVTLVVTIIMIGWGLSVILTQPVTAWFATSSMIWMALLLISAIWQQQRHPNHTRCRKPCGDRKSTRLNSSHT